MTRRNNSSEAEHIDRARQLRKDSTFPERRLWAELRGRRLAGHKFRRQAPVGPFIADFLNHESKVIIELDGQSHVDRGRQDLSRQNWLESQGFRILRVSNDDLMTDLDVVLDAIERSVRLDSNRQGDRYAPTDKERPTYDGRTDLLSPVPTSPTGRRCRGAADEGGVALPAGSSAPGRCWMEDSVPLGDQLKVSESCYDPHPAFGHLLPTGEGETSSENPSRSSIRGTI